MATKLDRLVIADINGVNKIQVTYYAGKTPLWVKFMRTFSAVGTVRTGKDSKVNDCGVTMMFLGYAENYEGNCYRMCNPLRNSGVETWTCDVT